MPYQAGSSAQRIRIGLTSLAFVFLIVLLGSIISRSSRDDSANAVNQATSNEPSEPLAELGVAPGGSADRKQQRSSEEMTARASRALLLCTDTRVWRCRRVAIRSRSVATAVRRRAKRPTLLLLTSLPLLFGEDFSLAGGGRRR